MPIYLNFIFNSHFLISQEPYNKEFPIFFPFFLFFSPILLFLYYLPILYLYFLLYQCFFIFFHFIITYYFVNLFLNHIILNIILHFLIHLIIYSKLLCLYELFINCAIIPIHLIFKVWISISIILTYFYLIMKYTFNY